MVLGIRTYYFPIHVPCSSREEKENLPNPKCTLIKKCPLPRVHEGLASRYKEVRGSAVRMGRR